MPDPLKVLVDDAGVALPLPGELRRLYGGSLSLPARALYANFVQSIDGVVTLTGVESPGSVLSGKSPADRFVMGLLRAAADAVLVGAGTLRDTPGHHWTADHVFPELKKEWAQFRTALGIPEQPRLVLLTSTGDVDVHHPAVRGGATFLTTAAAAEKLGEIIPGTCEVQVFEGDHVPLAAAMDWMRAQGYTRVLSEAGPRVTAQLVQEDLLDDLFVTVSPVLAGRSGAGRLGLVEGVELLPQQRVQPRLASARVAEDFLLLRYSLH